MSPSSPVRRLAVVLAAGSILLIPLSAAAISPAQIAEAVPAVAAPSRWQSLRDLALRYESQTQSLEQLGLDSQAIVRLWNRFGGDLSQVVKESALSPAWAQVLAQPNSREELLDRYSAYLQDHPDLSAQEVVRQVNMGLDRPFYQDTEELSLASGSSDTQMLVNKYHALPSSYVPKLVPLTGLGSGSLAPEAAESFSAMVMAAKEDGISLRSKSAYRSYSTQKTIYNRNLSQYSQSFTDTFSARPGYSEHQTGLALDINSASMLDHFERTPAYAWLQEHCAQYGFILRYPEGKDAITGYRFEPWHYRYVGTEIAAVCMEEGLTLEEYFAAQPSGWGEAPAILWEGQALTLNSSPLCLEGNWYLPVEETALALGWTRTEESDLLSLTNGEHQLECVSGQRCRVDGVTLRLTDPVLTLENHLYLSVSDLCSALGVDLQETEEGFVLTA